MLNEAFIKLIMECPEYGKAPEDENHPCHNIIWQKDGSFYRCEPYRCVSHNQDVKVMFLGLSPGNPENDCESLPLTPRKDAPLE